MRRPLRLALWATAGLALAGVFMAWRNPHLVVELAAFVAACF
jgi:hypothetical membrane protein